MNQEMMKFYKENKVNPFAGCWPILIQIPIFLGMFWMLRSAAELYGQGFLWADDLSEQARRKLGIYFVKEYEAEPNQLTALTLEPRLEQILISRVRKSQFDVGLMMDPSLTKGILEEIEPRLKEMADKGLPQVLVTSSDLRLAFRRFMEPSYPKLAVLAFHELPNETQVNNFAAITLPSSALPEDLGQAPIQDISETVDKGAVPVAA